MLEINNLQVARSGKQILDGINLRLIPHTLTALVGKNGCGKSTLVSCINQITPYRGEIHFSGRDLALMPPRERASLIAYLPQALKSPHITTEELIAMGRSPYLDIGRHMTPHDKEMVEKAIHAIGIEKLIGRYVDTLSGGERQKVYLAMTIAQDTRLLVLDEPTTYMDMAYEHAFLAMLDTMKHKNKKTLLVVMHNLNQAVRYADQLAVLDDGKIVFHGPTEECLRSGILERVFSVHRYMAEDKVFFAAE